MAICGPHYEVDSPVRDFRDLRSARHSRKRSRDELHRYGRFRDVTRGQRNVPHLEAGPDSQRWGCYYVWPTDTASCPTVDRVPKRNLWLQAREGQRQRGIRCRCCYPKKGDSWRVNRAEELRGTRLAKEQAQAWMQWGGEYSIRGWNWHGARDSYRDYAGGPARHDHYNFLIDECEWLYPSPDLITMDDIVRMRSASGLAIAGVEDDTASFVSDWSDIDSIVSWVDEDVDGVVVDSKDLSYDSDWSEVDGDDAHRFV